MIGTSRSAPELGIGVERSAYVLILYVKNYLSLQDVDIAYMRFLADRTNGRAIGTVLRLSVCLSVTLCIGAKRCVLEQKLLLRAYRKSYMRNRLVPK